MELPNSQGSPVSTHYGPVSYGMGWMRFDLSPQPFVFHEGGAMGSGSAVGFAPGAGVGIASVILGTLVGLSVFLAYGTTAQVSRALGAGRPADALTFGIAGLYLAVIIGVAVLAVGWPLAATL